MKLEINDDGHLVVDGRVVRKTDEWNADIANELARRVNGWEELVAILKEAASYCESEHPVSGCLSCRAREALRKAGVE